MGFEFQLEFNIENKSPEDMRLYLMQKQVDQFCDSMGKVRRRLFAELGEMKKICAKVQQENEDLRNVLKELKYERTEWTYGQNGYLFDVREPERSAC